MSVKLTGKNKLDANVYNNIVIREVDGNFIVKVIGDKLGDKYESISYKLTDDMKKMDASEKIIAIVDSFLENTQIDSIETESLYAGYDGMFITIDGTRRLCLQINNSELLKMIIKMVKNKYDRDRYEYCDSTDVNSLYGIFLNSKQSSYTRQCISCDDCESHGDSCGDTCPSYIQFKLMYVNGKMASFDEKFISRFIYDKLWEFGENAIIIEKTHDIKLIGGHKVGDAVDGYLINCGNLNIMFYCTAFNQKYVLNFCSNIVDRYNKELRESEENCKKRQLKMEGF